MIATLIDSEKYGVFDNRIKIAKLQSQNFVYIHKKSCTNGNPCSDSSHSIGKYNIYGL